MSHKAIYFRILGVTEIIGFVILLIGWIINMVANIALTTGISLLWDILVLVVILFFGPAFALLFFGHADMLERLFPEENGKEARNKKTNYEPKNNLGNLFVKYEIGSLVKTKYVFHDPVSNVEVPKGSIGEIIESTGTHIKVKFVINGKVVNLYEANENFIIKNK